MERTDITSFPDALFDDLLPVLLDSIAPTFDEYVRRTAVDRWMLLSDYVVGAPGRKNDAFVFTLVPGGHHLDSITKEMKLAATRDIKDIATVSDAMMRLLTDCRLHTFCFLINGNRRLIRDLPTARGWLDRSVTIIEQFANASELTELIAEFRGLRQRANANGFKLRLVEDMMLATTLSAFIIYFVSRIIPVVAHAWISDRDSITSAYGGIARELHRINVNGFCERALGWSGPVSNATGDGTSWSDFLTRVPDYFAGTLSAIDLSTGSLAVDSQKYQQVLEGAVAGRESVSIVRLNLGIEGDRNIVRADVMQLRASHPLHP